MLHHLTLKNHRLLSGKIIDVDLSYQIFGKPLQTAPVVLINHALTGNSDVAGEKGWWKNLVGENRPLDICNYSILCFNVPGNGFDGKLTDHFQDYTVYDIASFFLRGLEFLKIDHVHLLVGGSLGGSIGWEMLSQQPALANIFIPIACDYKTTDWLNAQCHVQKFLLNDRDQPLEKARFHAMLCYRTPQSLNERFKNEIHTEKQIFISHDWLTYHGKSLRQRFALKAYHLMNHLLTTINVHAKKIQAIKARIHLIGIDTDLFFPAQEIKNSYHLLKQNKPDVFYHEVKSIHGHDAFLIEYDQLNHIINTIIHEK